MKERMPSYGGQAVIEGVLMRGQSSIAMANRNPEGEIVVSQEPLTGIYKTSIRKIPLPQRPYHLVGCSGPGDAVSN